MAEPLNITKKLKERLGELPIFEYVGTCEGRPVYMVSKLSKYELEHTCNGGPSYLIVNLDDIEKSTFRAWNDYSFQITSDPDIEKDK